MKALLLSGFIICLKIYRMPVSPITVKKNKLAWFPHMRLPPPPHPNPTFLCILISSLGSFHFSLPYIFCSFNLFPFSPRFSISLSSTPPSCLLSDSPTPRSPFFLPQSSPSLKALPSPLASFSPLPATFSRLSL